MGLKIGLAALVAGVAVCGAAGQKADSPTDLGGAIEARLEALEGFAGQVIVERDGEILIRRAFGEAAEGRTASMETRYYIGSVAKTMTSAVVLGLCEEGVLELDATIDAYLADVPEDKQAITIRHLLAHRSGTVANHEDPLAELDRNAFELWALAQPLATEPGAAFAYSNVGYSLLAAIVDRVSDESFQRVVKTRVFERAGMHSARFITDPTLDRELLAIGRGPQATEFGFSGDLTELAPTWLRFGPGGIVCTADDLLAFDHALASGKILGDEMLAEATSPSGEKDWGLGWRLSISRRDTRVQWHNGGFPGFGAEFFRLVDDGVTLVVVSNREGMSERARNAVAGVLSSHLNSD